MISVFDLYKIGIGPSSSHTMGPMIAARRFREMVTAQIPECTHIQVELYGSLAWTGAGHATDRAICLGLVGEAPDTIEPDGIEQQLAQLAAQRHVTVSDGRRVRFDPATDILLEKRTVLPGHSNGMRFLARTDDGKCLREQIFYSIGGGFVLMDGETVQKDEVTVPYPFTSGLQLLEYAEATGLGIADIQRANEQVLRNDAAIDAGLDAILDAMFNCVERGLSTEGILPGGLKVRRRAKGLRDKLLEMTQKNVQRPHEQMDWVSAYAMAVNEENAAGSRVVTAPTNGAAGVVPAVLRYYRDLNADYSVAGARNFLLTSGAIGSLIKMNASISGAEVGCQGEVGSAAAMAAAGLAAVLGGTPTQIENAAEIALEHHLGMTCDPVGGLVQIPCIERNAIGAQKAITAASLALRGDGTHRVSLDEAINTMRQTGADMQTKYKETSQGGLAVNVAEC